MKRICCIALLLLPLGLLAQTNITGIGFVKLTIQETTKTATETNGLDLYANPDGETIACLQKEIHAKYFIRKIEYYHGNREELSWENSGMVHMGEFGHYGGYLQYYEEKNNFIRIKINGKNYWINLDALASKDGGITTWKTFLTNLSDKTINSTLYNMNLRTSPTTDSDKVMLLKKLYSENEAFYAVKLTGNFRGNWAEVKVYVWDSIEGFCLRENALQRTEVGWIKYLDDKGFPNLFPLDYRCC